MTTKPTPLYVAICVLVLLLLFYAPIVQRNSCDKPDVRLPIYEEEQLKMVRLKISETKRQHFDVNTGTPYLIPSDDVLKGLSELQLLRVYWKYINSFQTLCRNQSRLGSFFDGGKEACVDNNYKPSRPCIVYSFGMNIKGKTLPRQINFIMTGIAGKNYFTEKKWQMKTLQTIMRDIGHEKKVIDILKIDIEGGEWDCIPNMIETGVYRQVKQILIEIHVGRIYGIDDLPFWGGAHFVRQLGALRLLYEHGFRIFMRERNLVNIVTLDDGPQLQKVTPLNEIGLINMAFYDKRL